MNVRECEREGVGSFSCGDGVLDWENLSPKEAPDPLPPQ